MTETRSHSELMKELNRLLNVIFSEQQDNKEAKK
jgi:hypothetical protein